MTTMTPHSRFNLQPTFRSMQPASAPAAPPAAPAIQMPQPAFQGGDTVHFSGRALARTGAVAALTAGIFALTAGAPVDGVNPAEAKATTHAGAQPQDETIMPDGVTKCTFSFEVPSQELQKEVADIEKNTGCKFTTDVRMADKSKKTFDIETTDQTLLRIAKGGGYGDKESKRFLREMTQSVVDGFQKIDDKATFTNHFVVINCADRNNQCYTLLMQVCQEEDGKPPKVTVTLPTSHITKPGKHFPPIITPPGQPPVIEEPPGEEPPVKPPHDCGCPEGSYDWLTTTANNLRAQWEQETDPVKKDKLKLQLDGLDKLAWIIRDKSGLPADDPRLSQIVLSPELQDAVKKGKLTPEVVDKINTEGGLKVDGNKVGLNDKGQDILDEAPSNPIPTNPGTGPGAEPGGDTTHTLDWYRNPANRTPGMDKLIAWAEANNIDLLTIKVDPSLTGMSEAQIADLIDKGGLKNDGGTIKKSDPQTVTLVATSKTGGDPLVVTIPLNPGNQTGTEQTGTEQTGAETDPAVVTGDPIELEEPGGETADPNAGTGTEEGAGNGDKKTGNGGGIQEPVVVPVKVEVPAPKVEIPAPVKKVVDNSGAEGSGNNAGAAQPKEQEPKVIPVVLDADDSGSK